MPEIRKIDYPNNGGKGNGGNPRVETGAVQFGDDWPGYFIRGDNAFHLAIQIESLRVYIEDLRRVGLAVPFEIRMAMDELVGVKNDIVTNTVVNGPESYPRLITKFKEEHGQDETH